MLTDREASQAVNIRVMGSSVPLDEYLDASRQYTKHFADERLTSSMLEVLPRTPSDALSWGNQIDKALKLANQKSGKAGRNTSDEGAQFPVMPEVPGMRSKRGKTPAWLLRMQAERNPILSSLLAHYRQKTLRFADPFYADHSAIINQAEGFDLVLEGSTPYDRLSPEQAAEKAYILEFIKNCGDVGRFTYDGRDNSQDLKRVPFDNFLAEMVFDRFVIDGIALEPNWTFDGGRLSGLYLTDPDSIYVVKERGEAGYVPEYAGYAYAQVFNKKVETLLTSNELYYAINNPRSHFSSGSYGVSEVEACHTLTVGITNILSMTNAHFDRNSVPEGVMVLSGMFNDEALVQFRDEFQAYREDPGGGNGLPIMAFRGTGGKAEWIAMQNRPKDLEHSQYASLLVALHASQFGADVMELNFSSFGGSGSSGLSSNAGSDTKLDASRDRGWKPWMAKCARIMNDVLTPVLRPPFSRFPWRFVWRGLEKVDPKWLMETYNANHKVNETRAAFFGSLPIEDGDIWGRVPSNNPAISQQLLSGHFASEAADKKMAHDAKLAAQAKKNMEAEV